MKYKIMVALFENKADLLVFDNGSSSHPQKWPEYIMHIEISIRDILFYFFFRTPAIAFADRHWRSGTVAAKNSEKGLSEGEVQGWSKGARGLGEWHSFKHAPANTF